MKITKEKKLQLVKEHLEEGVPLREIVKKYNYNISNPQNSIIGNQEFATINNKSFNIDELKKLIELYGDNDKAKLYQLTSELEKAIHNDNIKKGMLSRFSDLIAKHSWLPLAIAQILSAFITK